MSDDPTAQASANEVEPRDPTAQPPANEVEPGDHTTQASANEVEPHDPTGLDLASEIARATLRSAPAPRPARRKRAATGQATRKPGASGRDMQPLSDALSEVVTQRGWAKQISLHTLLNNWASLVGDAIADHSTPESYADKVLGVRAESTAWATSLRLMAHQLVAKLNAELGDGTVVRIVVRGPSAPSWKHGRRSVQGRGPRDTYG